MQQSYTMGLEDPVFVELDVQGTSQIMSAPAALILIICFFQSSNFMETLWKYNTKSLENFSLVLYLDSWYCTLVVHAPKLLKKQQKNVDTH